MFTGESGRRRRLSLRLAVAAALLWSAPSWAIYLDDKQTISFRGRIYSQWNVRADDSPNTPNYQSQDNPTFASGQLIQQRNFYNPELDANLTEYTKWMRDVSWLNWLAPDDFGFRAAGWGFYDGIYDYGSSQYATARSAPRIVPQGAMKPFIVGTCGGGPNRNQVCNSDAECPGSTCSAGFNPSNLPLGQQTISYVQRPCMNANGCVVGTLFSEGTLLVPSADVQQQLASGKTLEQIYHPIDGRDVYAHQNRLNELYFNYSKGPVFVRIGRQSISWGESDTIALLDANNPFEITQGAPGFFEDLDEARIPLWTIRTSYELFRELGPFSSGFVEGYLVPGAVDQHIAQAPSPTGMSAYGPTGIDPHLQLAGNLFNRLGGLGPEVPNGLADINSIVLFDKKPPHIMKRSRGGVRFQTVAGREHTVSGWWYRTYNNAPIARLAVVPDLNGAFPAVSTFERADVDVFGLADTFFLEPIDSIIRFETEYFLNEASFLDWRPAQTDPNADPTFFAPPLIRAMANIPQDGTSNYDKPIPRTNHLRWELGVDRNMFIRFINPTNSILVSGAFVGDYNLSATSIQRYAFGPGRPMKPFEGFFQVTTQSDFLHGRLTPRLTSIINYAGVYAFKLNVDYRITDYLIASLGGALIEGRFHQLGFFRSYDQVGVRVTYQLN